MNQQQPSGSTTPQQDGTTHDMAADIGESDSSAADPSNRKDRLRKKKKSKHKDGEKSKVRYDIITSPGLGGGGTKIKLKLSRSPVKGPEPGKDAEKPAETEMGEENRPAESFGHQAESVSHQEAPAEAVAPLASPQRTDLGKSVDENKKVADDEPKKTAADVAATGQKTADNAAVAKTADNVAAAGQSAAQEETRKVDKIVISPSHGDGKKHESKRAERTSRRGSDRGERTRNDSERSGSHRERERPESRERPEPKLTEQEIREKKEISKRLASIEATRRGE